MTPSTHVASKIIDYFIRFLVLALFLSFFFASDRIIWMLTLISFFVVGLWAVLFPPGILLWVKSAYPEVDETDPRLWSVPRFIGTAFMLGAGTLGVILLLRH
jgi:hypothetical protein